MQFLRQQSQDQFGFARKQFQISPFCHFITARRYFVPITAHTSRRIRCGWGKYSRTRSPSSSKSEHKYNRRGACERKQQQVRSIRKAKAPLPCTRSPDACISMQIMELRNVYISASSIAHVAHQANAKWWFAVKRAVCVVI